MVDDVDVARDDGAARASGVASSSSGEEVVVDMDMDMASLPSVLRGCVDGGRLLRDACHGAARGLAAWTRRGGAARALLVASVGSVALAALTVLLVVVFVLVAAATSAAAVSAVVSLAALSAFLAVAYVGALSVVIFVVAATTAATVVAITIASGWAALFWIIWLLQGNAWILLLTDQSAQVQDEKLRSFF